jgi:hypothetical protein
MLCEDDDQRDQRKLAEWVERRGGTVTAREVQQGHRQYRTASEAEAALNSLVKAGRGCWQDIPPTARGGRPTRVYKLSTVSTSTKPPKSGGNDGCVDVDSVDGSPTQLPDPETGLRERVVI